MMVIMHVTQSTREFVFTSGSKWTSEREVPSVSRVSENPNAAPVCVLKSAADRVAGACAFTQLGGPYYCSFVRAWAMWARSCWALASLSAARPW